MGRNKALSRFIISFFVTILVLSIIIIILIVSYTDKNNIRNNSYYIKPMYDITKILSKISNNRYSYLINFINDDRDYFYSRQIYNNTYLKDNSYEILFEQTQAGILTIYQFSYLIKIGDQCYFSSNKLSNNAREVNIDIDYCNRMYNILRSKIHYKKGNDLYSTEIVDAKQYFVNIYKGKDRYNLIALNYLDMNHIKSICSNFNECKINNLCNDVYNGDMSELYNQIDNCQLDGRCVSNICWKEQSKSNQDKIRLIKKECANRGEIQNKTSDRRTCENINQIIKMGNMMDDISIKMLRESGMDDKIPSFNLFRY